MQGDPCIKKITPKEKVCPRSASTFAACSETVGEEILAGGKVSGWRERRSRAFRRNALYRRVAYKKSYYNLWQENLRENT